MRTIRLDSPVVRLTNISWGHHFVPGFGHDLYGLLIWALIIGVAILLIRRLFGNKD